MLIIDELIFIFDIFQLTILLCGFKYCRVVGSAFIISGLYAVLWGKGKEMEQLQGDMAVGDKIQTTSKEHHDDHEIYSIHDLELQMKPYVHCPIGCNHDDAI